MIEKFKILNGSVNVNREYFFTKVKTTPISVDINTNCSKLNRCSCAAGTCSVNVSLTTATSCESKWSQTQSWVVLKIRIACIIIYDKQKLLQLGDLSSYVNDDDVERQANFNHFLRQARTQRGDMDVCPPVTVVDTIFRCAKIDMRALHRLHHFYGIAFKRGSKCNSSWH